MSRHQIGVNQFLFVTPFRFITLEANKHHDKEKEMEEAKEFRIPRQCMKSGSPILQRTMTPNTGGLSACLTRKK
jgi:hypothetical protein